MKPQLFNANCWRNSGQQQSTQEGANEISFICKGKPYTLSTAVLSDALRLPENNCSSLASNEKVRQMLSDINYACDPFIS